MESYFRTEAEEREIIMSKEEKKGRGDGRNPHKQRTQPKR